MTLIELIERLEAADQFSTLKNGFGEPHSYRGYYEDLAFEPRENVLVHQMLIAARSALGKTFTGYKGGDFKMGEYTRIHIAKYGECGEELSKAQLEYMLKDTVEAPVRETSDRSYLLHLTVEMKNDRREKRHFVLTGNKKHASNKSFAALLREDFDMDDWDLRTIRVQMEAQFSGSTLQEIEL